MMDTSFSSCETASNIIKLKVTIIECISASSLLPPAFVLTDGPFPNCQDLEGVGRYEHNLLLCSYY